MLRFLCSLADEKEEALCRLTDTFAEKFLRDNNVGPASCQD